MAQKQKAFLDAFKAAYVKRFGEPDRWLSGQVNDNKAELKKKIAEYRRNGRIRANEGFELGDLVADTKKARLIVEFDSGMLDTNNIAKLWPYLRRDLDRDPPDRLLLLHFSSWNSYGSRRDLWNWFLERMKEDASHSVTFEAWQFDHGDGDRKRTREAIEASLDCVGAFLAKRKTQQMRRTGAHTSPNRAAKARS